MSANDPQQRVVSAETLSEESVEIPAAWRAGRTAQQKAEILRRRALALARPLGDEAPQEEAEFVTLDLGAARFAIAADLVREVVSLEELTPLPGTPAFVLGLVNVRGKILAAIDLAPRLGAGEARADRAQVVLVQTATVEVAIAADACGMCRIAQGSSSAAPPSVPPYASAVTDAGVAILEVERVIADTQRALQEPAGRDAA